MNTAFSEPDSVVLITGATGGLGKAFAAEYAARGENLLLTDLSPGALMRLATGIMRQYGVSVTTMACDISDSTSRDVFWDRLDKAGIRISAMANVAGMERQGLFLSRDTMEMEAIVRLNVEGTMSMVHRALEFRDTRKTFRIMTVSSMAAFFPVPVKAVYSASKRFLLQWSLALAAELEREDVSITVLCPAGMKTTVQSIKHIHAQGIMGELTTLPVGEIVSRAVDASRKGKKIVVPGILNRMLVFFGGLLPPTMTAALVGRRWIRKNREGHGGHSKIPA